MEISEAMRKCRIYNGYTQEQLAAKLGVSRPVISHWETGRRKPNANNARKIAAAFGVPLNFLCARGDYTPENLARNYKLVVTL